MPRTIVLDTFPLSSIGKREPLPGVVATLSEECHQWIKSCLQAGNEIIVPSLAYYEAMRELKRLDATSQIARITRFCQVVPNRLISVDDSHLEMAATLWSQARKLGKPTASPESLDGDVILVAQVLSRNLLNSQFVVATTNPGHLGLFLPADDWRNIIP